jgi:hypothetical protein
MVKATADRNARHDDNPGEDLVSDASLASVEDAGNLEKREERERRDPDKARIPVGPLEGRTARG